MCVIGDFSNHSVIGSPTMISLKVTAVEKPSLATLTDLGEPRLEDAAQLVGHEDDVVARRVVRVAVLEHEPHVGGELALRSVPQRSKRDFLGQQLPC